MKTEQLIVLLIFFLLSIVFVFFLFLLVLFSIQSISLSLFFSPLPYFLFFICLRQMYDELVKSDQTTVCMFTCIAINKTKTETLDAIKDGDALSFYVFYSTYYFVLMFVFNQDVSSLFSSFLIMLKVPLLISRNYYSLMLSSGLVKHLVLFLFYFFLSGSLSL